ncbi:MAG: PilZ domain-containing protein [Deltaproteobacteria bacterium]|nr:PilZ domain-containing protein [Deltaproteobacteria bacterium]
MSAASEHDPERRDFARHFVCIPAYVQREQTGPHIALIRNISLSGALILIRKPLQVDESLDLSLHLNAEDESAPAHEARATVVRTEPLAERRAGLWSHSVGVRFPEPLVAIEDEIKAVSARLAARYGPLE